MKRIGALLVLVAAFFAISSIVHGLSGFKFEAEAGAPAGQVSSISDATASGGQAVSFNASGNGNASISTACKYSTTVTPAFCDTFDQPYAGTKTQTGDLDPVLWGVSRNPATPTTWTPSHNGCSGGGKSGNPAGDTNSQYFGPITPPPGDVQICNGQVVESLNDGGGVRNLDMYPKQPFDFTGRTGRVVFDVSNDGTGGHGAWTEFEITDDPVPGTRSCSSQCGGPGQNIGTTRAMNYVGFSMATGPYFSTFDQMGVDKIFYNVNGGEIVEMANTDPGEGHLTKGCLANISYQCPVTKMNHYEVQISQSRIDIYGTDAFSGTLDLTKTPLKHLMGANVPLAFSKGLVWMNDVHYNANKSAEPCGCGVQTDHSFAWDNLGFDGPKTYRDLGYDVPLPNTPTGQLDGNGLAQIDIGYGVTSTKTFTLPGVTWQQTPTKVKAVLNVYAFNSLATITASLNGHTEHAVSLKMKTANANLTDAMSFTFPASDAVQGTNTITFNTDEPSTRLLNISLIMVAGAPVP